MGTETNMSAIGKEAQAFATDKANEFSSNPPRLDGNNLQIPMKDGSALSFGSSELSNQSGVKRQWTPEDIAELKGLFDGSDDEGKELGTKAKEKLFGNTSTIEGQIHQIMIDGSNQAVPDWSKDKIIIEAEKILNEFEKNDITDCRTDKIVLDKSQVVHQPQLEQCEQVIDRSGECTITHNYRAGVIRYHDGYPNMTSCGENCTQMWLSRPFTGGGGGGCKLHEYQIRFSITNPDAITKVVLDEIYWDDQLQLYLGPDGRETKILQLPYAHTFVPQFDKDPGVKPVFTYPGPFSGAHPESCEQRQSWYWRNTPLDITKYFKEAKKGDIFSFKIRVAINGNIGGANARLRVYYDSAQAVVDDAWVPPECVQNVYAINDGFAKGTYTCVQMPPLESNGCALVDSVYVCPHHLNPSPLKGISNLCQKVAVNAKYDFYKGQMDCWTDINGNKQCPNNQGGALDKCSKLEDRGCQFISSECTEGAMGASGTCYVTESTYDCGKDVVIADKEETTETVCSGDISCIGKECVGITESKSESFAQISAIMNALQYMGQDMQCTEPDPNGPIEHQQNVTCTAFSGNPAKCKIAVGGIQDCCENQNPVGMKPYLGMIMGQATGEYLQKPLDKVLAAQSKDGLEAVGHGAWSSVSQIGHTSWAVAGYINTFSSFIENISSWKDIYMPSMDVLVAHAKTAIRLYIQKLLTEKFMNTAGALVGDMIGGAGLSQGASQALGAAGAALGVIAAVYAAYCAAVMLIQAVYKCTEDELKLTSMRDVGNCHYIGSYCAQKRLGLCVKKMRSYCCFSSPLSRIVQEQVRKQGDMIGGEFAGFGSAKNPQCAGIPIEKIGLIDWDRIDLSEWIAILENNGQMPNGNTVGIDQLTGSQSKLNYDGKRVDSKQRTEERIKHVDVDAERERARKKFEIDTGYRGQ